MINEETIKRVRKLFKEDRFATVNGAYIEEIGSNYAKCSMILGPDHRNAAGGIMGGALFTLADFTFAVAANWEKMGTVSLCANINYLGAVKGERVTAEAICVRRGRTTSYYTINIYDETGALVSVVTSTGFSREG